MVRIEQIIDKFNIPHKEEFEPRFDMEVEDYFLNGTLTIEADKYYIIRVDNHLCIFNFTSKMPYVDIITEIDDNRVGYRYYTNGSLGYF